MADNIRYQSPGLGFSAYPVTRGVDPVGMRTRANLTATISDAIDRMSAPLYKRAADEATREGMVWAAQNPVTEEQLNAAVASGQDPLAERHTYFGDAARKVQASMLATNLSAKAQSEMTAIEQLMELGKIDLQSATEKINGISSGYAQALTQVDPETGIRLKAALTTHGSAVVGKLSDIHVKRYVAEQKGAADKFIADTPAALETLFRGGEIDVPGMGKVTPDQRVQLYRDQAMRWVQITGDANYADKFEKAVSAARINAAVATVADKDFAGSTTVALDRIAKGDLGKMSGTWAAMTTEDQIKVRENFMRIKGNEYTAREREEKDEKQSRAITMAGLVTQFYTAKSPAQQRAIGVQIATLNATGIGGPVYEPGTIKALLKPEGDGEGGTPMAEVRALELIDRQGITDLDEIRRRTGVSGKMLVRVQNHLYNKGDQHLNRQIKTMASIPDGIVQMTGDQQRRFQLLSDEAEILKRKAIAENGTYDPFVISDELRKRRDEITREKAANEDKDRLANYMLPNGKKVALTPDTSPEEMKRIGLGEAQIASVQAIQNRIKGK